MFLVCRSFSASRASRTATLLLLLALAAACGGGAGSSTTPAPSPQPTPQPLRVELEQIVTGVASPTDLQEPNDGTGRLFIVEQAGTIRIFQNGALLAQPFLDIRHLVRSGGEMGLLGLAFHPNFAQNRRFFVNFTRDANGQLQTVIAEFLASSSNPNMADPVARVVLIQDQPFENHNGGQLQFGPDGLLYIALGDGGAGGDPLGNAQNLNTLLGKLLRVDVTTAQPYVIPADNPFVGQAPRGEIWAYGLRNPWRFSFARITGTLFLGDVGQVTREEVNIITRGGNYGWNRMEGSICFPPPTTGCGTTGLILPIHDYGNDDGRTVVGGYVYRGARIPELAGAYLFGDFISGRIWRLDQSPTGVWVRIELLDTDSLISSFGQDQAGEVYVLDLRGTVFRLRRAS